jgi:hypothetical protein
MQAEVDLSPLAGWPSLRTLALFGCRGITSLEALADTRIDELVTWKLPGLGATGAQGLAGVRSLRTLWVTESELAVWHDSEVSPHVERLILQVTDGRPAPERLRRQFPNLSALSLAGLDAPGAKSAYQQFAERHGIELD